MASKPINIFFSISLVAVFLTCYNLLAILFLAPSAFHISSLVLVQSPSRITPLVVVGLLAAFLSSATIAFTTRSVNGGAVKKPTTVKETRRLAEWTVSSLGRFKYTFTGRSFPLKFSGILLFATTAAVGPVLLAGISQADRAHAEATNSVHSVDVWTPWITRTNSRDRGGSANDVPILSAALASNDNLSLPAAPVCNDTKAGDACSVSTRSAALFVTCTPRTLPNDDKMAIAICTTDNESDWVRNYCSTIIPTMRVNLTCGAPQIYANFLTGPDPLCVPLPGTSDSPKECNTIPETWATILGVWVGGVDVGIGNQDVINIVDYTLEYGNVTLQQIGATPPTIDRTSFEKSTYLLSDYASVISNVRAFAWREQVSRTPYYFTLKTTGTAWNDIYESAVASGLLGVDASNSAEYVARQIERNFDWATLAAFAKRPDASDYTTTVTTVTRVYVYNRKMLAILLVPLLATVLAAWGRLRVGSDDQVLGYDPIAIARRGPDLIAVYGSQSVEVSDMYIISPHKRYPTNSYALHIINGSYARPLSNPWIPIPLRYEPTHQTQNHSAIKPVHAYKMIRYICKYPIPTHQSHAGTLTRLTPLPKSPKFQSPRPRPSAEYLYRSLHTHRHFERGKAGKQTSI